MKVRESIVPAAIVLIFIIIVVPLPTGLLDILISGNIICCTMILLRTLFLKEILKFSVFPSILLLTTVFRLSLNIATTRMILQKGQVGEVVELFGIMASGNSVITGLVIFLVVSIVQFIVIAKGSERVAEVSARFALDSMPGKQMSIDADLRSGSISLEEARSKRDTLQSESSFYGALDGSMKFVKGDAIAGLLITVVNIVGGIITGISSLNLGVKESIDKFCLLSIGDGLISQIPSLMGAIASGILVTRVSTADSASPVNLIPNQIFGNVRVRLITGIISGGIAFVPNAPKLPFLFFCLLLISSCIKEISLSANKKTKSSLPLLESKKSILRPHPKCEIKIPNNFFKDNQELMNFKSGIEKFKEDIFNKLGIVFPDPYITLSQDVVNMDKIILFIKGSKYKSLEIRSDIDYSVAGLELCKEFEDSISLFVDDIFTRMLLEYYEDSLDYLISSTIPDVISITELTVIIRALIEEDVSIRNIDLILQTVAECAPSIGKGRELIREIRRKLGLSIVEPYLNDQGEVEVLRVDSKFEISCINSNEKNLLLDNDVLPDFFAIFKNYGKLFEGRVLMVARGAREMVRDYLRATGCRIPVLSYDEIGAVPIKEIATMEFSNFMTEG